jgi:hypothetical protein
MLATTDWGTVASLGTAGATLVLAIATFAAVRSANLAARTAERSLLAGLRPVLFPSRIDDPPMKVSWVDRRLDVIPGAGALAEVTPNAVLFAMNLRNVGAGIAVLHGWQFRGPDAETNGPPVPLEQFRRLTRDLFVPPGTGFWQGGLRNADDGTPDPDRDAAIAAINSSDGVAIDVLYGDDEGGQRTVSRFRISQINDHWRADVVRHFFIDNPDPR